MSRRLPQNYRCQPLGNLARQLRYAPPNKRLEQVLRTEELHDQIDPAANYPFDFVVYRITGYHSETDATTLLPGEALLPDLRLLIDMLSFSVDFPHDASALTPSQLAAQLSVSTKTIARWRQQGLRWRWALDSRGKQKQMVIPADAVKYFQSRDARRMERAKTFTQIEQSRRQAILDRARRIARRCESVTLNQVATHLSRRTGRALETVRQMLEQHDRRNPQEAIFEEHQGPLSTREHRIIARAYRMGISAQRIAAHFKRSTSTVYRAMHLRRAAHLRRLHIHYIASPMFERSDADEVILQSDVTEQVTTTHDDGVEAQTYRPSTAGDLPAELLPMYAAAPMTVQHQRMLFRRFNYVKYKAIKLRDSLDRIEPRSSDLDAIESLLAQAQTLRNTLANANYCHVLSVARRHLIGTPQNNTAHLMELLEIGNRVLYESIESHDLSRNELFAKYLTFQLMRQFSRHLADRPAHARSRSADHIAQVIDRMRQSAREFDVQLPI